VHLVGFIIRIYHDARSPEGHVICTCVHMARIKIEMHPCLYIGRKMGAVFILSQLREQG